MLFLFVIFLYIIQSSAKSLILKSMSLQISFTYPRNCSGPKTLPCGTPEVTLTSYSPGSSSYMKFHLRPLLFWCVTWCRLVVCYYHFRTACPFQGSSFCCEDCTDRMSQNVYRSQKTEGLFFISVKLRG